MSYEKLLKQIAKENNTTVYEVEKEMKNAIKAAGFDIEPALFIAMVTAKIKKTIYRNSYNS